MAVPIVENLLRYPDQLRTALEVTLVASTDQGPALADVKYRRILAVISHKSDWNSTEEGCLLVFKYRRLSTVAPRLSTAAIGEDHEDLDIQSAFPIYGEFGIMIGQMRRGTLDLRSNGASASNVLEQPRSVMTLSITPAEGLLSQDASLTFCTTDVDGLKATVTECKRLKDVSDLDTNAIFNLANSTTNFSWLRHYVAKRTTIGALTSVPQDLRQVIQHVHERLSPACAGHVEDEHADVQTLRDDWIRLKAQDASRRGRRRLTLRLGTFNVNGKMPTQDLSAWVQGSVDKPSVGKGKTESMSESKDAPISPLRKISPFSVPDWISRKRKLSEKLELKPEEPPRRVDNVDPGNPDMFVFGFQELDLSTEALFYSSSTVREDAWCHAIFAALGEKGVKYEKLVSKQLVGMLLLIIVKKSLRQCFGNVKTTAAGAGILGVLGNKGGSAIRLSFTPPPPRTVDASNFVSSPITLTFVDTHLAAFDEMAEKRNSDFHELSRRLLFDANDIASKASSISDLTDHNNSKNDNTLPPTPSSLGGPEMIESSLLSIYDTDVLFWMGDLNYRVDVHDLDIRGIMQDKEWDTDNKIAALLRFDQLRKAMQGRLAFVGFQEGEIRHMPTYRFSPGIVADALGYDIKRRPAWTDRILYMHGTTCQVNQLSYSSHPQITLSDHRPVASDFQIDSDLYNVEEHQSNIRKRLNEVGDLDIETGQNKGGLKVEEMFINFGKIYLRTPVERKVTMRNTGKSPCAFRFVPIHLEAPIHPEWLRVYPMTGVLLANDSAEIVLRAEVDDATAAMLNLRSKDLSSTLILHTMFGRDHFISLSGEFQYTCFANRLSRLTRLQGPVRSLKSPNDLLPESQSRNAPKEVLRLVNWMMSNPISTNEIFICKGNESTVVTIRECLDTGDEFPYPPETSDIQIRLAFADTLLRFLNSLPEAIIPVSFHSRCLGISNRDEAFEVLDGLSPASINVWISLTAFLNYICQFLSDEDRQKIASAVSLILLRDNPDSSEYLPISPVAKCRFLLFFIR